MDDTFLRIYHRMPAVARSAAASLRGHYLNWWRYGSETDTLVTEALERDRWNTSQWQSYQETRLANVLHRAATRVPFYRELWQKRRRRGDRSSWEILGNWPILTKELLRENPEAFIADDCNPNRMLCEHTSGTSGKPLKLWQTRKTARSWYALNEARLRVSNGISRKDRWAILGGQLVARVGSTRPPFWVWNAPMSQLYMSSYHLAPELIPSYLSALEQYGITYILGYASSVYALARAALESRRATPTLRLAISNAEPLFSHQRETIGRAFSCSVRDTYGMSEIACAASECEAGIMHVWPDVGWVELLQDSSDEPAFAGQAGRIIATGFLNLDMPLIRYQVGDRATPAVNKEGCQCGRRMPAWGRIEGRLDDVIRTRDGRQVGRLDPVFKADFPIVEAQIIQESLEEIRVRIVPAIGYTQKTGEEIARRLSDRVGDIAVIVEKVNSIPRSANGKFRAVISMIDRPMTLPR
jgi:phenylacetate-CoA ligase